MKKTEKKRRSSLKISLAIIGTVTFATCGQDGTRPIYQNRADCVGDWGDNDCDAIPDGSPYRQHGAYFGRFHPSGTFFGRTLSRSTGVASVTRGGFGHSSSFHSGSGRS